MQGGARLTIAHAPTVMGRGGSSGNLIILCSDILCAIYRQIAAIFLSPSSLAAWLHRSLPAGLVKIDDGVV